MRRIRVFCVPLLLLASAALVGGALGGPFTDKGTQPELTYELNSAVRCVFCHGADYDGGADIEPHDTWAGSMMAQASRDPLFWAALDVANHDIAGIGDWCLRCHVPTGWLGGRSEPPEGSVDGCALTGPLDSTEAPSDFEGVGCHLCHRMMSNPTPPPGEQSLYDENAQYWIDDERCPGSTKEPCRRGPYDYSEPGLEAPPHVWQYSALHESSDLCGTCHNVTSPVRTLIVDGTDTGVPFPIERTFREWQQSDFAQPGPGFQTCQNCHMPDAAIDPAYACFFQSNNHTGDMPIHRFAGGNAWVPDVLRQEYPTLMLDTQLTAARDAALDMLQNRSALVELTLGPAPQPGGTLDATVKVTNLTGHKLPTGYPEGRRMWIQLEARDAREDLLWQSGAYDAATGVLTVDPALKVYESKQGVHDFNGSGTCDVVDGVGSSIFHFVLNDCVKKDNRIPPLGFSGASDVETAPVGSTYPETSPGSGTLVNWDATLYSIPIPMNAVSPVTVSARLLYQTTSKEYVEFLLAEANTNEFPDDCIERSDGPPGASRAQLLYDMWNAYGKAAPVEMGSAYEQLALLAPTPGEASGQDGSAMLVTAYDEPTHEVSVVFDPACSATDHTAYVGELSAVALLAYDDQACGLGVTGSATFPVGAGSRFWLIVGHDGAVEGSYGVAGSGSERPEDTALASCDLAQDLSRRCDP